MMIGKNLSNIRIQIRLFQTHHYKKNFFHPSIQNTSISCKKNKTEKKDCKKMSKFNKQKEENVKEEANSGSGLVDQAQNFLAGMMTMMFGFEMVDFIVGMFFGLFMFIVILFFKEG